MNNSEDQIPEDATPRVVDIRNVDAQLEEFAGTVLEMVQLPMFKALLDGARRGHGKVRGQAAAIIDECVEALDFAQVLTVEADLGLFIKLMQSVHARTMAYAKRVRKAGLAELVDPNAVR